MTANQQTGPTGPTGPTGATGPTGVHGADGTSSMLIVGGGPASEMAEFRDTVRELKTLLEEMNFRQRGNSVLRTALAFILIFGTTVVASSSVSYCINSSSAPGWCAIVPGTAIDARTANDLRISNLEMQVKELAKSVAQLKAAQK